MSRQKHWWLLALLVGCPAEFPDDDDDDDAVSCEPSAAVELPGPAGLGDCNGRVAVAWSTQEQLGLAFLEGDELVGEVDLGATGTGSTPWVAGGDGGCAVVWAGAAPAGGVIGTAIVGDGVEFGESGSSAFFARPTGLMADGDGWVVPWTDLGGEGTVWTSRFDGDGATDAVGAHKGGGPSRELALAPRGAGFAMALIHDGRALVSSLGPARSPTDTGDDFATPAPNQRPALARLDDGHVAVAVQLTTTDGLPDGGGRLRLAWRPPDGPVESSDLPLPPVSYFPDAAAFATAEGDAVALVWQQTTEETVPDSSVVGADIRLVGLGEDRELRGDPLWITATPRALSFGARVAVAGGLVVVAWQEWDGASGYRSFVRTLPAECL